MSADDPTQCPHCRAGEPSVWDHVLDHFAHPCADTGKLKFCHSPWRLRCRACSADVGACSHTSPEEAR